jgi:glyoxylate reductase
LPPTPEELAGQVRSAEGLLSLLSDRVDADLIARAPRLRAIANYAVGYDNIDVRAAAARGIPVGNTPDVLTDATADLTFALLLAVARKLPDGIAEVRSGRAATARRSGSSGSGASGAPSRAGRRVSRWRS